MNRAGLERALFWTMAVAVFAAALACLAARAVDRSALATQSARQGYLIVRVESPEGPEGLNQAARVLSEDPRIASVEIMSTARASRLLETWGAGDIDGADLPPLRLIEATVAPDIVANTALERDLNTLLAGAGIEAAAIAPPEDDTQAAQATRMRRAALFGALALCAVMSLIVMLAARALASRRSEDIHVLADLGATRTDACLPIADAAGGAGFAAGALGAIAAGAAGLALLLTIMPDLGGMPIERLLHPADIAPLLAAPFLTALAAGIGARFGADALYSRAVRLR